MTPTNRITLASVLNETTVEDREKLLTQYLEQNRKSATKGDGLDTEDYRNFKQIYERFFNPNPWEQKANDIFNAWVSHDKVFPDKLSFFFVCRYDHGEHITPRRLAGGDATSMETSLSIVNNEHLWKYIRNCNKLFKINREGFIFNTSSWKFIPPTKPAITLTICGKTKRHKVKDLIRHAFADPFDTDFEDEE